MYNHSILLNYYNKYKPYKGGEYIYLNDVSFEESFDYYNNTISMIKDKLGNSWFMNSNTNIFELGVFNDPLDRAQTILKYYKFVDEDGNTKQVVTDELTIILVCIAFDYVFNHSTVTDEYWNLLLNFMYDNMCRNITKPDTIDSIKLGINLDSGIVGSTIILQYMNFLFKIKNKFKIPENIKTILKDFEIDTIRACKKIFEGGRYKILYNNYRGGNIKTYHNQYIKYKLKIEKL